MIIFAIITATAVGMLIHETGHLIAARNLSITCSEVSLGLGNKLFGVRLGGVEFSFRMIPLGSFVRLDGTMLKNSPVPHQLCVHLAGIVFNLVAAVLTYGTVFSWINFLIAGGNLLPLYQHDGWKCGLVIIRAWMKRKSQPAEWALTFSGGFVSLLIAWLVIRMFV
jgi:membrane-associated protease RseP (regulator of RpoE activity)